MGSIFSTPDVPAAPGPSPELLQLYEAQRQQIDEQRQIASQMSQIQMQSLGFQEDPTTGEWVQAPLTGEAAAAQGRSEKIRRLMQERQIAALEGSDVSPALEQELSEERRKVEEEIRRGPGMDSTAGRQRLSLLDERQTLIRDASRRNDIVTLEQLLSGRTGQELQSKQFTTGGILQTGQQQLGSFQALSGAYNVAMQPWLLQQQQQGQYRALKYQSQLSRQDMLIRAGAGAAVGGLVGGPTGALAGAGSGVVGGGAAYAANLSRSRNSRDYNIYGSTTSPTGREIVP